MPRRRFRAHGGAAAGRGTRCGVTGRAGARAQAPRRNAPIFHCWHGLSRARTPRVCHTAPAARPPFVARARSARWRWSPRRGTRACLPAMRRPRSRARSRRRASRRTAAGRRASNARAAQCARPTAMRRSTCGMADASVTTRAAAGTRRVSRSTRASMWPSTQATPSPPRGVRQPPSARTSPAAAAPQGRAVRSCTAFRSAPMRGGWAMASTASAAIATRRRGMTWVAWGASSSRTGRSMSTTRAPSRCATMRTARCLCSACARGRRRQYPLASSALTRRARAHQAGGRTARPTPAEAVKAIALDNFKEFGPVAGIHVVPTKVRSLARARALENWSSERRHLIRARACASPDAAVARVDANSVSSSCATTGAAQPSSPWKRCLGAD